MAGLDDEVRDFVDEYDQPPPSAALLFGTVTNVSSGTSTDGRSVVTVNLGGSTQAIPYDIDKTTPTAGSRVAVLVINSQPLILCRVGGFPPTS